jgi:hyperpolarization activated cyclic nucleotide-gated potassium channel 1
MSFITDGDYPIWDDIDRSIDFLFMVDIIFTLLSAFYDEENNLIKDHKLIAINYLKGWFAIDLIVLPFYYVVMLSILICILRL